MEISVIIPTYNRAATLRATIESLVQQDLDEDQYEVLVVDNSCTDDTPLVVQEIAAKGRVAVRYLREPRPGVHYARNLGALRARGSILYYTDDDMLADSKMLGEIRKPFMLDPLIGTVTGRVLPAWQADPPPWVRRHCQNSLLSLQLRTEELIVSGEDIGVYSCHQAIRKHVLLECGGFNPENTGGLWVGDGETGLNLKLRARSYKFAFTAKAVTRHVIPPERMTQEYLNKRLQNQGNADTYTWFRNERPDHRRLVRRELRCWWNAARHGVTAAWRFSRGRDDWRVSRASVEYERARWKYARRLRRDPEWRQFVLRDNWLETEP